MDMNNWKEQLRAEFQMEEMPTLESFITSLLASERAHWLRSEIEKLESAERVKSKIGFEKPGTKMQQIKQRVFAQGYNQALTSIITRYKEELLELESK